MSVSDLNRERWGKLATEARVAAAQPHLDPSELGKRATAMREVSTPLSGGGLCACNVLRWSALWFAQGDALTRAGLAPLLDQIAERVAIMLSPDAPPPEAAAAAVPREPLKFERPEQEFAWQRRADVGRG